jgi:manganese/zinc/iron transport system permease protein
VRGDAAIGVTFTSLFAVGVILISQFASEVDLDLDCVLYGVIEYTPLYTLQLGGREWGPQPSGRCWPCSRSVW